jgi:hypothetical protein
MTSEGPTAPISPAPAEPPTATLPPARGPRGRAGWVAVGVALVALLLSVVSTSVSLYALSRSGNDTKTTAGQSPVASVAPTGGQEASQAVESPAPQDSPSLSSSPTQPDVLSPQAEFEPAYNTQEINPLATSSNVTYIDLDEPRVLQGNEKSEVTLRRDYSASAVPYFLFDQGTSVAMAKNPSVQPADCVDLIRKAPVPYNQRVPAQRETVICVATSLSEAHSEGIKQKMVVMYVSAIGDDGRVSIRLSAWHIPT